jgi:hypothetical protein
MSAGMQETIVALLALGALHGINPGMGWLFAVASGMQEKRGLAVWRALGPLAWGHAFAIVAALLMAFTIGIVIPPATLRVAIAIALIGFGLYRLRRHAHPRYGGMRVGARDLAVWSFLVASAHGAGLMVLPFALGSGGDVMDLSTHHGHAAHVAPVADLRAGLALPYLARTAMIAGTHTIGYLVVTAALSLVVYHKAGLHLLRSLWINLNLVWAVVLILSGVATLVL